MKKQGYFKSIFSLRNALLILIIYTGLISCNYLMHYWPNPHHPHDHTDKKKGIGWTIKHEDWVNDVKRLHVSWHYTWGAALNEHEAVKVEFVPMVWGRKASADTAIAKLERSKRAHKIHHLLGFNEPDNKKQSNMSVEDVIALWPKLMAVGLPLGSPATVNPRGAWMKVFMKKIDSLGYRVDFITVHSYGGINVNNFINKLKDVHNLYGRPIWITEFAVADWKAKTLSENKYSNKEVLQFMKDVLPRLDSLSFVERYAWFSAKSTSSATGTSALFNPDGSLTELGKFYADYQLHQ
jgi:hypothetical protein